MPYIAPVAPINSPHKATNACSIVPQIIGKTDRWVVLLPPASVPAAQLSAMYCQTGPLPEHDR